MVVYKLTKDDFDRAFEFAVNYHLDPAKPPVGRTSGEPRGLGAVLDNFVRGKLIEISVQKMLENANEEKEYVLNFDIMSTKTVKDEPDITAVIDGGVKRAPRFFIEVKGTSAGDRWVGTTVEQLSTIQDNCNDNRKIYFIYVALNSNEKNVVNPKALDLVGMYLKSITKQHALNSFANLVVCATLEFIITSEELLKYGKYFNAGDSLYETDIFQEVLPTSIEREDGSLRAGIKLLRSYNQQKYDVDVLRQDGVSDTKFGKFNIRGGFRIYEKANPKSQRNYIYCATDTVISNDVFGTFRLEEGKCYKFNLETVGRYPNLKRNNLWISKNRVKELLAEGCIEDPSKRIKQIVDRI